MCQGQLAAAIVCTTVVSMGVWCQQVWLLQLRSVGACKETNGLCLASCVNRKARFAFLSTPSRGWEGGGSQQC